MLAHLPALSIVYVGAVACLLCAAAWQDVLTRTIADRISVALLVLGIAFRLCEGWAPMGVSLLVALTLFVVLLPLCSGGILGGADLKLIVGLAAGLSPQATLQLLLAVTMAGGFVAAFYLLMRAVLGRRPEQHRADRPLTRAGRIAAIEFWRIRRRAPLPYGVAIALGAAVVVLQQQGV